MLKKKLYKLAVFIIFAIIPTILLLSACGEKAPKYYYFTIDALPSHVSEVTVQNTTGGYGSDSKGKFLTDGDSAEIRFFIEEGYSTWNLDVVVTKGLYDFDGETKASLFTITVREVFQLKR